MSVSEERVPNVKRIAVVGAGLMGSGIAAVLVASGFEVSLADTSSAALKRAEARANRLSGEPGAGSLSLHSEVEAAVAGADLVIEAVPEKLDLKRDLFGRIDAAAPAAAYLATNTSELSVTAIAAATARPERVAGMHWFNPPERMRLVEVVRGVRTSAETLAVVSTVAEACGKTVVTVEDRQGFVTTRVVAAVLLEGARLLEEGVASKEDIDAAVRLGLNHPMGPLQLADYIGLDTVLLIADAMAEAYGDRFRPPQGLRKLVEAGKLGRKSGGGYYDA